MQFITTLLYLLCKISGFGLVENDFHKKPCVLHVGSCPLYSCRNAVIETAGRGYEGNGVSFAKCAGHSCRASVRHDGMDEFVILLHNNY